MLNDVYRDKIYTNQKPLKTLKDLERKAINANVIGRRDDQIKILCMNTQNLIHHIEDVKGHPKVTEHNLIFLSETWLSDSLTLGNNHPYQIANYHPHYINIGNGKEIASFSEPQFQFVKTSYAVGYQLFQFSFSFLHYPNVTVPVNIISLYRSSTSTDDNSLITDLTNVFQEDKICIICGDFNIR